MPNNYNKIAGIYDALSRIIYQRSIVEAQVFLLQFINTGSNVLIAGGGTGWILEELSKINKENITVVYVEKSSAMIKLAKKKKYKNIHTEFIQAAIENCVLNKQFDVIITPFLFDNFKENKVDFVFKKLNTLLKPGSIWLYADFVNDGTGNKIWQKILLKSMYLFFRITTNIEAQKLVIMHPYFKSEGYRLNAEHFYYNNFIQAKVYRKTE